MQRVGDQLRQRYVVDAGGGEGHGYQGISALRGRPSRLDGWASASFGLNASDNHLPFLPSLIQPDTQYILPSIIASPRRSGWFGFSFLSLVNNDPLMSFCS